MIKHFEVKNFRSILESEMDFTFNEPKAPTKYKDFGYHIFFEAAKSRIVPCMAIFGANASGKTNFIRALSTLRDLVQGKELTFLYNPNLLHNNSKGIYFNLSFILNDNLYNYSIEYTKTEIIQEHLQVNKESIYSINNGELTEINRKIFNKTYDHIRIKDILKIECGGSSQTKPFLTIIAERYPGLCESIYLCFYYIKKLIIITQDDIPSIETILNMFPDDKRPTFQLALIDFLKKFDFDIENIKFSLDNPLGHKVIHKKLNGSEIEFNLLEESFGTQTLVKQLSLIIISLIFGQTLIVDELDRALHPVILNCLIDMYKDPSNNHSNAQLVFTTHTTDILDNPRLRTSEISVINKTKKNGSHIIQISSLPDIKNKDNFRKQYQQGRYSGIPYAYI